MPYFKDEKHVIDLDRTFFFIDDEKGFKPSLLYHGRINDMPKPDGLI